MIGSPPLTFPRRCVISGAVALFACGFLVEGVLTFQRGYFSYRYSAAGKRSLGVLHTIGEPHARRIGAGCLAVGASILLWAVVILAPGLRVPRRRRVTISLASGLLVAAGAVLWIPPWLMWPNPALLLAYSLPPGVALLWRATRTSSAAVQEVRRTRAVLALLALVGLLWALFGVGILAGAAAGGIVIILAVVHLRLASPEATPARG